MKMLVAVFALLCLADVSLAAEVALGADCTGAGDTCAADLVCQSTCRAKVGATTCGSTDANCVDGSTCVGGTCTCPSTHVDKSDKTGCLVKVEGDCSGDGAACAPGSTCPSTGTKECACDTGKTVNSGKTMCLTKLEGDCEAAADCISNLCTEKKCACAANTLPLYDLTDCKKAVGQTCADGECGTNAECTGDPKKCQCKATFFSKDGQICGKKVDTTCTNTNECVSKATCDGESTKKCACMTDYVKDGDGFCKKSSAVATVGSVLLMLGALLTSRLL